MGKRWVAGFGVAAFLGLGGGVGVHALGRSLAPPDPPAPPPQVEEQRVVVQRVEGAAYFLSPEGEWHRLVPGQNLAAPLTVKTQGLGTRVLLTYRGARLAVMHDAMVLLGGGGGPASIQVESGLALFRRTGREIRSTVPSRLLIAEGSAYGVWVLEKKVLYSVLDGELDLTFRDDKPQRFARAREVEVDAKSLAPSVLESTLVIDELRAEKKGKNYLIQARAAPNVLVFHKKGDKVTEIPVSAAGIFEFTSDTPKLPVAEIFAIDAAGRMVQPAPTSQSVAQILAYLDPQAAAEAPAPAAPVEAPAAPPAAPEAPPAPPPPVDPVDQAPPEPAPAPSEPRAPKPERASPRAEKAPEKGSAGRGDDTPQPLKVDVAGAGKVPEVSLEKPEATLPKSRVVPGETVPPPAKKPPPPDDDDDDVDERAL